MKIANHILVIAILLLVGCKPSGELFEDALCIQNITTIDPAAGVLVNQTVVIQEGRILRISDTADLLLHESNTIIDGSGKFLIPGLWDAHVHFAYMENLAPRMFDLFLTNGITSVRDTGGEINFMLKWKEKSLADPTGTPRVMIAGPLLDGTPNVYDGSDPGHPPLSVGLDGVDEVTEKIEELVNLDVDLLKAYEMLTPEQFRKVTEHARANGLKVTGHVPLSMDVISASNAGMNSMEHLRNVELSSASNAEELLDNRRKMLEDGANETGAALRSSIHRAQRETAIYDHDEERADQILRALADNQTWQIPTLTLNTGSTERPFTDAEFQSSFQYLPDSTEKLWLDQIDQFSSTEPSQFRKDYSDWMFDMVGKVHEAGIPIMAGTDTPIFFLTPGRSLHEELATLVKAGLSPMEALKTATTNPALYFKMQDELGSIREGFLADLVILNANPLDDIENTREINGVIKQGNIFDREMLDGKLEKLDN